MFLFNTFCLVSDRFQLSYKKLIEKTEFIAKAYMSEILLKEKNNELDSL